MGVRSLAGNVTEDWFLGSEFQNLTYFHVYLRPLED